MAVSATASAAAPAAPATPSSAPGYRVQSVCGAPRPGTAACRSLKLVPASLTPAELQQSATRQSAEANGVARSKVEVTSPIPGYLTPELLHAAYALPDETAASQAQTIAVVDAFDDPSAEADLGVYDAQFGLPACTSANGCFRKVNEEGLASPLPRKNGGWASEESIDVQMAHAICESCHVLLVEASSERFSDLAASVEAAVKAAASEISNSYGAAEAAPDLSVAGSYDHPGVAITVSSGDCGYLNEACAGEALGAEFPADSPDVVAVGGTSLSDRHGVWTSKVWREGGSGCSVLFAAPLWQSAAANFAATGCGTGRAIADVSAVGNPDTGVDVYDSTPEGGGEPTGWTVFGGTSVSSPIVAAEFALAGGAHGVAYPAATLYAHVGEEAALYDVVRGKNGSCKHATICRAAPGYDGPSGVGSPVGLAAFAPPGP
jgi:subtilase family serine protease